MRQGTAGGWAQVSMPRIILLSILNRLGIRVFNHQRVISFNMPVSVRSEKTTLSYSFNLNCSLHPRIPYQADIASLKGRSITLVGSKDEAMEATRYPEVMQDPTAVKIIEGAKHLDIVLHEDVAKFLLEFVERIESTPRIRSKL
jgi:hypothetical protein